MGSVSDFLAKPASGAKPTALNGPGSNGYWLRDIYDRPGTWTWTARKDGKIKIQAIGAASGGAGTWPGASGAFGEVTLTVAEGDTLTIVVGTGGGGVLTGTSTAGGTTSISGTPVGGTPLVLVGAAGIAHDGTLGTPGSATGPWDKSYAGAKTAASNTGSPSSASPFGAGKASTGQGGAGWGGVATASAGASSHRDNSDNSTGAMGFFARAGTTTVGAEDGQSLTCWDFEQVDSGGGGTSANKCGTGGVGAGGSSTGGSSVLGGPSLLGGGTGRDGASGAAATPNLRSGAGAGGGACTANYAGGKGGHGYVQIFSEEV